MNAVRTLVALWLILGVVAVADVASAGGITTDPKDIIDSIHVCDRITCVPIEDWICIPPQLFVT